MYARVRSVAEPIPEGQALGVMELGSFTPPAERELNLLAPIAPNAGVALPSAQERARMVAFLAETQQQADKLAKQGNEIQGATSTLEKQASTFKYSDDRLRRSNEGLRRKADALKPQASNVERQKSGLEEQKVELAQSTKYKSDFLSNVSHELRTPLMSMLLISQSLVENSNGNLSTDQVQAADVVHSGGEKLLTLINELRRRRRRARPFERCLRQVLKNLLSNAVKFTSAGKVTMQVGLEQTEPPNDMEKLMIRVRDTGVGIPKKRWQALPMVALTADAILALAAGGPEQKTV